MQQHKPEWEGKQDRLKRLIKKEFFYKQNVVCGHSVEESGGRIFSNQFYLEVDETTDVREVEQQSSSEYIILIITEYIKKENVLEKYLEAYKKLYDNIEHHYKSITKKADIDYIVEKYFLRNKRTHKFVANANTTKANVYKNVDDMKKKNKIKYDMMSGTNIDRVNQVCIEMETYTVSVVLKLKTQILNVFPTLRNIVANLKTNTSKEFYIGSRTGIIEKWKQKIYEYSCEKNRTKMFLSNKNLIYREKNEIHNSIFNANDDYKTQRSVDFLQQPCDQNITQNNLNQMNNNLNHHHNNNNLQKILSHENSLNNEGDSPQGSKTIHTNSNVSIYTEAQSREFTKNKEINEMIYTTRDQHANSSKGNENQESIDSFLRRNSATFIFPNYKFYEIKITTDKNLISLKSILMLIEFITTLHLYFWKCELEQTINKQISWKELHKYKKTTKHEINYELFYNMVLGNWHEQIQKGSDEQKNDNEELLTTKNEIDLSNESLKKMNIQNRPFEKIQKNVIINCIEQKEKLKWEKKKMEEMDNYVKYLLDNIINECDFFFSIEFLHTLNIFQCSFFFTMFKKLLLKKNSDDDALIMLTYCAYKTQNKEMIAYCFWRLLNVFENETLPNSWIRRDVAINNTSAYDNYNLLDTYNLVSNYALVITKDHINLTKNKYYSNSLFYETLNIIKDDRENNISEIDAQIGNMYYNRNVIDKYIFWNLIKKVKKEFYIYNKILNGYIINEVQRIRNFSEFYSCCYILRNNKKEKVLMGFKKKGENKVYIYKYDKIIKKKFKESQIPFHMPGFLGVLICNFTGMKIKVYNNGISKTFSNFFPKFKREIIITILFESNIISELPRHFICYINKENQLIQFVYENKCPIWNEEKEMYELPFYGRVKLASAKNLQLILKKCILSNSLKSTFSGKTINDIEYIIAQNEQKVAQTEISSSSEENILEPISKVFNTTFSSNSTKSIYTINSVSKKDHMLQKINKSISFDNQKNKNNSQKETFEIINRDEEDIYLIFGKNSKDLFTLDFRHPLTTFEAFAIAISSLLKKKAVS